MLFARQSYEESGCSPLFRTLLCFFINHIHIVSQRINNPLCSEHPFSLPPLGIDYSSPPHSSPIEHISPHRKNRPPRLCTTASSFPLRRKVPHRTAPPTSPCSIGSDPLRQNSATLSSATIPYHTNHSKAVRHQYPVSHAIHPSISPQRRPSENERRCQNLLFQHLPCCTRGRA